LHHGHPQDTSVDLFFPGLFGVLQDSCSLVDPDARLGYCAAKDQVFLGYRVQLLIDDKKRIPLKIEVTAANVHDSTKFLPVLNKVRAEHPDVQIQNANADNAYKSAENSAKLSEWHVTDSTAPRKSSPDKIPKKRQNQRKCIEGMFGIMVQCFGLGTTWVRGLSNVAKDTYLKFIAFFFQIIVAFEIGVEENYLKPTYFFA
jgi:IS5 family transposase